VHREPLEQNRRGNDLFEMMESGRPRFHLPDGRLIHSTRVSQSTREAFQYSALRESCGGAELRGQREHVATLHVRSVPSYGFREQLQVEGVGRNSRGIPATM